MNRRKQITVVVAIIMAVQIILFDALQITSIAVPMPYVACIILLPLGMSRLGLLVTALAIGLVEDMSMGIVGLNIAASLPLAFFRQNLLLRVVQYPDRLVKGRIPSERGMGRMEFNLYVILSVVLHHLVFFSLEWMSFDSMAFFATRLTVSIVLTTVFVYAFMLLLGRILRDE